MRNGHHFWEQLRDQTSRKIETPASHTIVEITEDRRVLIENHLGVTAYGTDKIVIKVRYGFLCVCGKKLEILHMSKDQLVVYGCIQGVHLQRKECL